MYMKLKQNENNPENTSLTKRIHCKHYLHSVFRFWLQNLVRNPILITKKIKKKLNVETKLTFQS